MCTSKKHPIVARSRTVARSSMKSDVFSITSTRLMGLQSWLASTAAVLHLLWLGGHALITWRSTTKICNFLISDHWSLFCHYPCTDVNCLLVQPTICNTGNLLVEKKGPFSDWPTSPLLQYEQDTILAGRFKWDQFRWFQTLFCFSVNLRGCKCTVCCVSLL